MALALALTRTRSAPPPQRPPLPLLPTPPCSLPPPLLAPASVAGLLAKQTVAGNCGLSVELPLPAHAGDAAAHGAMGTLFAEELGLVLEVAAGSEQAVLDAYR